MSDIVERLRWSAASTEVDEMFAPYGKLLDEAADKIEELRDDIAALSDALISASAHPPPETQERA